MKQLRDAPVETRAPLLDALEHTGCAAEDACDVLRRCLDAYRRESEARRAIDAARAGIAPSRAPSVRGGADLGATLDPRLIEKLLDEARRDLDASLALTKACADLEAALRRRHSL